MNPNGWWKPAQRLELTKFGAYFLVSQGNYQIPFKSAGHGHFEFATQPAAQVLSSVLLPVFCACVHALFAKSGNRRKCLQNNDITSAV